jgi:hypothetical protein
MPRSQDQIAVAGGSRRTARVHSQIDRVHRRLFIGGRKLKMVVIMDADSGEIIGQPFPIGDRIDANVYDPETGLITAATREGALHIIHEDSPDKYSVVETAKTEFGPRRWGLIRRPTTSTSPHQILVRRRPPPRNSPIRSQSLPRERFTF